MTSSSHRASLLLALGIAVLLSYYAVILLQQRQSLFAGASDFSSFYAAGRLVDSGAASLVYDRAAQRQMQSQLFPTLASRQGPLPFIHAPFELLIFAPLALLSYSHAVIAWYTCNLVLLISVPLVLRKQLPVVRSNVFYALLALIFFLPANIALLQGQDSILLLLLFALAFVQLSSGRDARAGCVLALATFKPQLVLPILLLMAIARKWKLLIAFFETGLVLLGISIALVGWRAVVTFPRFLMQFNRLPAGVAGAYPETMPNLRGLLDGALGSTISPAAMQFALVGFSVFLLLLVTVACLSDNGTLIPSEPVLRNAGRRPYSGCSSGISDINFALLMVATLLVAYHLNMHDLALFLLPIFLVTNHLAGRHLTPARLVLGIMSGLLVILPSLLPPPQFIAAAALLFLIALLTESCYADVIVPVRSFAQLRSGLD